MAWLVVFVVSGIGLGMTFELLQMHAGPAHPTTFLTSLFGFWAQLLVSAAALLCNGSWRGGLCGAAHGGAWTWQAALALLASSLMSGLAQALDYTAVLAGGYTLCELRSGSSPQLK